MSSRATKGRDGGSKARGKKGSMGFAYDQSNLVRMACSIWGKLSMVM